MLWANQSCATFECACAPPHKPDGMLLREQEDLEEEEQEAALVRPPKGGGSWVEVFDSTSSHPALSQQHCTFSSQCWKAVYTVNPL